LIGIFNFLLLPFLFPLCFVVTNSPNRAGEFCCDRNQSFAHRLSFVFKSGIQGSAWSIEPYCWDGAVVERCPGVSENLIAQLKTWRCDPSYKTVVKLVNLGMTAEEIFGETVGKKILGQSTDSEISS
jgi:hypothetical protein